MILKVENISKSYDSQPVLTEVSFEVKKGETIAIVGPSGSGKTTLLNMIGALDKPDSGSVFFNDTDIGKMSEEEQSLFRNQNVGFVFQMHYLLPQCSVLENVLIPTLSKASADKDSDFEARALSLLETVGLKEHINKLPSQLSGGECQRTAFVRALINRPSLLLADEPTGSLDQETADILSNELIELNKSFDTTLIVVTHSMKLAEKMDKIWFLRKQGIQVDQS
jgi:ABC-type lipoprotein export system ATPase subunit